MNESIYREEDGIPFTQIPSAVFGCLTEVCFFFVALTLVLILVGKQKGVKDWLGKAAGLRVDSLSGTSSSCSSSSDLYSYSSLYSSLLISSSLWIFWSLLIPLSSSDTDFVGRSISSISIPLSTSSLAIGITKVRKQKQKRELK